MKLTISLSYYNQTSILPKHTDIWNKYPPEILKEINFFIMDDCSKIPAEEILKNSDLSKLNINIYRVEKDLYCNIAGVRNLSAKECKTEWLMITDMDTLVDNIMIEKIMELINLDQKSKAYRFNRKVLDNDRHPKNGKLHPAVCLIRKSDYWKIGGCEEDLVGSYGMTDPSFWYKAKWDKIDRIVELVNKNDIFLQYLPDGESDINRDVTKNRLLFEKRKRDGKWSKDYVRFPWKKIM